MRGFRAISTEMVRLRFGHCERTGLVQSTGRRRWCTVRERTLPVSEGDVLCPTAVKSKRDLSLTHRGD